MAYHIFVTGGVMSSIGKGIAAASLASLLQIRGFKVRLKKLDPYINVDPGTMSPHKHGEVFVMGDGCEADLDFGHYERFTDLKCSSEDSITTGKIYSTVLTKERRGDYLGSDIQVIPHITNEIKSFIFYKTDDIDFNICEIGGTVGDIEGLPYIEAIRQIQLKLGKSHVMFIHLSYLPYMKTSEELKTKPTQHSVKTLQSLGIQPDLVLCRSEYQINDDIRKKLSMFCNISQENVIEALDSESIYLVPGQYYRAGFDRQVCKHFEKYDATREKIVQLSVFEKWGKLENSIISPSKFVKIAVIAKYMKMKDAYISLAQAIVHAGLANDCKVEVDWIDSDNSEETILNRLKVVSGIIVPGGFSERGTQNKIAAIKYAREHDIPFLGICLGMQLAVIEACRNIIGMNANSHEFSEEGDLVVDFLDNWNRDSEGIETRQIDGNMGGSMRLGNHSCLIQTGSLAEKIYGCTEITERHRHRYEVNMKFKDEFKKGGIIFSGISKNGDLPEIIERSDNKWFMAVQFHPEFKSRPFACHPIFKSFIEKALEEWI